MAACSRPGPPRQVFRPPRIQPTLCKMKHLTQWLMASGGGRRVLSVILALLGVSRVNRSAARQLWSTIERFYALNGAEFTVKYFKEVQIHILHYLAGSPDATCKSPVWVGLTGGLPKVIPGLFRTQIRVGNVLVIRLVLTLVGVYRVIEFTGTLKLETITGGFTGTLGTLPEFMAYIPTLARNTRWMGRLAHLKRPKLFLSTSAGPNGGPGVVLALWDAYALYHSDQEWSQFRRFVLATWGRHWVLYLVPTLAKLVKLLVPYRPNWVTSRLHQKPEAAGKIRVFAIVDYWTQMILRPLHKAISQILREIPQDGTFDQGAAVRYMRDYVDLNKVPKVYSYDLSAATDRVPVILYQVLLGVLRTAPGKGPSDHIQQEDGLLWAQHWKELLTWRKWSTGMSEPETCMYSVGQPMGAYSSWVLLALCHHAIVQLAWDKVGGEGWFDGYVVLGDDVVIAHCEVAKEYLAILTDLGVEISLHKSLVSDKGVFEFAKRISAPSGELTGLPWGLVLDAYRYVSTFPTLVTWAISAGFSISPIAATRSFAYMMGLPSVAWCSRPIGKLPPVVRNALIALCAVDGPWWRDFSRLVSVWYMTPEELSEAVRLNLGSSVVDDWTIMNELKLVAADRLRLMLQPASWYREYTESLKALDIYSGEWIPTGPNRKKWVRKLEKFPQIVRLLSPVTILMVREYIRTVRLAVRAGQVAIVWVARERTVGIIRPFRWAFKEAWAGVLMNLAVPNAFDTDLSYARGIRATSRLVLRPIRVMAPKAISRKIARTNLAWITQLVKKHQPRLPRRDLL